MKRNFYPTAKNWISQLLICIAVFTSFALKSQTSYEGINTGSVIIDMGVTPQTISNGLKPYGLLYSLLKTYQVPVKWVINPSKGNDGIDFSHNGRDFRGGPFIVPAEFITTAVRTEINSWKNTKGVVTYDVVSFMIVPVHSTLTVAPVWTIDNQNDQLVTPYWPNAGIPTTSYNLLAPSQLGICNDLFILPHADPTWAVHQNLFKWNRDFKGGIWYGCHAGSVFENTFNPANTSERMNFLMQDGPTAGSAAIPFGSHKDGTPPYNKQYPAEPVMQFMGSTDAAHLNGSEQIYLPKVGWRPTTKIGVYDPTQADVPGLSPGPASVVAFGPGRGIETNGKICAEAGHSLNKGTTGDVAAQRVFWNFSFWSATDKAVIVSNPTIPPSMTAGVSYPLSANIRGGSGVYTYQWTSGCNGSFTTPTAASTSFTPNNVGQPTTCNITIRVTDNCGRVGFLTTAVIVYPPAANLPPTAVNDVVATNKNTPLNISVASNDYDTDGTLNLASIDLDVATPGIQTSNNLPGIGTFSVNGSGVVTFTPAPGYLGPANIGYTINDDDGATSNIGVISVIVRSGPSITCPADLNLNIGKSTSPDSTGYPTALADNCEGPITYTYSDQSTPGTCAGSVRIIRTWTATDNCGNSVSCEQNINVDDNIAPVWSSAAGSLDQTILLDDAAALNAAQLLSPVATDNSGFVNYNKTSGVFVPATCGGTITNTWTASDQCGNTSPVFTQIITLTDTTKPVWVTEAGSLNRNIDCENSVELAAAYALKPIASDDKSSGVVTEVSTNYQPIPGGMYVTRTWIATDACGNKSGLFAQRVRIQDGTSPKISPAGANKVIYCPQVPEFNPPTATDNCDPNPSVLILSTLKTPVNPNSGVYFSTRTWYAKDISGNYSGEVSQTITVNPQVTTKVDTIFEGTPYIFHGNSYTKTGLYKVVLTKPDGCIELAKLMLYVIPTTIVANDDESLPLNGYIGGTALSNILSNDILNKAPVTPSKVNITFLGSSLPGITLQGAAVMAAPGIPTGKYFLDYRVCEIKYPTNCDNGRVSVPVITQAPILTKGEIAAFYSDTNAAKEAALQATTITPGNCPAELNTTSSISGDCSAQITVAVSNECGDNASVTYTARIDNQAPTWDKAEGELDRSIEASDAQGLSDAQALAPVPTDNCPGTLTNSTSRGSFVPGACAGEGSYTNTWTSLDASGNLAVYTQVINVSDSKGPVWTTPIGQLDRNVDCDKPADLEAANALEPQAADGGSQATVTKSSENIKLIPGGAFVTRTWIASDDCGNSSQPYTQVIRVQDGSSPLISRPVANKTAQCPQIPQFDVPTATDNCDPNPSIKILSTLKTPVNPNTGIYYLTRTWYAEDASGNTSNEVSQTIQVNPLVNTTTKTICQGESFEFMGKTYSTQGEYNILSVNDDNCTQVDKLVLYVNQPSVAANTVNSSSASLIPGSSVALSISGGYLENGAKWEWYNGTCGSGTPVGTGSTIIVSPTQSTTYFVRAVGTCGTTNCVSVKIEVDYASVCNAAEAISFKQGRRKDYGLISSAFSNPKSAVGSPQNDDSNNSIVNYVSLGFGGELTMKFQNPISNGPGNDLRVVETSFGSPTCGNNKERVRVYLSEDGITWKLAGDGCMDADFDLSFAGLTSATYIRLRDVSLRSDFLAADANGYDVDGIICLNGSTPPRLDENQQAEGMQSINNENITLDVFPNPTTTSSRIAFEGLSEQTTFSLSLFDASGRLLKRMQIKVDAAQNFYDLQTEDLPPGVMLIFISNQNKRFVHRLMKN